MKKNAKRLIIVSNRLPIICQKKAEGEWDIEPSHGGLVTALDPVFKNRGGLWIGWPGTPDVDLQKIQVPLDKVSDGFGYAFIPVNLTQEERDNFYLGFSNEIIWPLFHDLQTLCNFNPAFFKAYKVVNHKFAEVIAKNAGPQDLIWIHDYHLLEVASELRKLKTKSRLAFFLHIPFPPLDIFLKLPWRAELMKGLMEFDVLGFQTQRDVRNFMECVRMFVLPQLNRRDLKSSNIHLIKRNRRDVALGSFPISIDYQGFADLAAQPEIQKLADKLREDLPNRTLIMGVDRLDYTKGIPYKLEAFRNALERYPELRGKVTLVQNVVPSREDIEEYHDLRNEIEQLVGEINGQYTHAGWVPIHYMFQSLDRRELLAFYRMAKIAMITPLKDGMNLVAKEYCASCVDEDSVLILSEFAGAAAELQIGALMVNPYHIEEMADKLYEAYHMADRERQSRMRKIRKHIKTHNIFHWAESFLRVAINEDLSAFPEPPEYVPRVEIA